MSSRFRAVVASVLFAGGAAAPAGAALVHPNDPGYSKTGAQAQAKLPAAWGATFGDPQVVIAVVGSGVDEIPDLKGKLVAGINVGGSTSSNSNTADYSGLSTAQASVAAAHTDNGIGIAGACPNCRLMPIRVVSDRGFYSNLTIAEGIEQAGYLHADAVLVTYPVTKDDQFHQIRSAVNTAVNFYGIPVVWPAGTVKDGVNEIALTVPAAIWVSGDDPRFNHVDWVDLIAPTAMMVDTRDGRMANADGTQYAAALVAGTIGLMKSINPKLQPDRIQEILKGAAQGRLDAYASITNPEVGYQPPPKVTLSVAKTGAGAGKVISDPTGIDCGKTCSWTFDQGQVTLTATANADSVFAGWGNAPGCGTNTVCVVDLKEKAAPTATFNKRKVTVKVIIRGTGKVTSTPKGIACPKACKLTVPFGTAVILTAKAAPICRKTASGNRPKPCSLSTFKQWSGRACTIQAKTPMLCRLKADGLKTVTATFGSPTVGKKK